MNAQQTADALRATHDARQAMEDAARTWRACGLGNPADSEKLTLALRVLVRHEKSLTAVATEFARRSLE